MKEKTIIFFDVWTKGTHHYKDLKKIFLKDNINIILFHFGSYGNEIKKELITEVNGINCFDMKYFNYDINKVINDYNPIAILYLSIDPLIMRACNLYAKKYNIKTFLTYPGLWSAQDYDSHKSLLKRSLIDYTKWVFSRSYNYLVNALPQYLKAIVINNNRFRILISFLNEEFYKLNGILSPRKSLDRKVNTVFVYNYFDKLHAERKFDDAKIRIVGVPDLFRFGDFIKNSRLKFKSNEFLYLGSGLRSRHMLLKNPNEYFIYLLKVKNYFEKFGKKIKFKLHISTKEEIKKISKNLNKYIEIVENDVFDEFGRKRIKNAIPTSNRCTAKRANGEQCTRRRKDDCEFCGTHEKGRPHGLITSNEFEVNTNKKLEVFAQEISGIVYYLDNYGNVYNTEDIMKEVNNPEIIAKYTFESNKYSIPSLGLV